MQIRLLSITVLTYIFLIFIDYETVDAAEFGSRAGDVFNSFLTCQISWIRVNGVFSSVYILALRVEMSS